MLKNQTALVTGGTRGIGKAIALRFAQQGATVAICGTNQEAGEKAVKEIIATAGRPNAALFFPVNVADHQAVHSAVNQLLSHYGHIDILVNNAGITRDQLLMKMGENDWDLVMDINVKSCYNFAKALVRSMMKQRSGVIINISSVVGITGNAGQANYAASKAAIIGLTKALAKELASRNIRVNCIAPGFIQTAMTDALTEEQKKSTLQQIALGRMGTPEEVANAALFLASSMSSYVTGQVLTVDGGMII